MGIECDTEIPENDEDCTAAMATGAMIFKLVAEITQAAQTEDEGE